MEGEDVEEFGGGGVGGVQDVGGDFVVEFGGFVYAAWRVGGLERVGEAGVVAAGAAGTDLRITIEPRA